MLNTPFDQLGLQPELVKAVSELGFVQPTPIQEQAIPHILNSKADLIGFAQTGTGKTAAFGLPILQQIDTHSRDTQALMLCPTRELCLQIAKDLASYSKYMPQLQVTAVYGGADIQRQITELKRGAHIVVATPGRALDLINRGRLKVESVQWLVLDEADEMLSMGFKDDLDAILANTPEHKRTFLFSATMPAEMVNIAEKYMHDPVEISVGKKNQGAENVQHQYYMVHAKDRYEALKRIADYYPNIYCLVFCRTRIETKEISDKLMHDGYNADALHGDLSQAQRDYVMQRFRIKQLQILVATDVAARGLDVNNLSHVIHYNLPDDPEVYIHRSGRTGRAGKKGISLAIIHLREKSKLLFIEKKINKKFEVKQVPGGKDICEKQLFHLIDNMEKTEVNEAQIGQFLPQVYKKLETMSREDLIKRFVSVEFNHFLAYYKDAKDLNADAGFGYGRDKDRPVRDGKFGREGGKFGREEKWGRPETRHSDAPKRERDAGSGDFAKLTFSVGKKDKISPKTLIGLINKVLPNRSVRIGAIDLGRDTSIVEVDKKYQHEVLEAFRKARFKGIKLEVTPH
ncbi:MAG: DEAD/DEAH box helicase [Saprospirales bacterium]|nr:DEAD/DEAH box helicase [Saprospirales bacterium]MBK7336822.1 DEAD/DEAH box helicase [Saprospirales bacterium]